jgi:hypothetical protein
MREIEPAEDVKLRTLCLAVFQCEAELEKAKIPLNEAKVRLKAAIAKRDRHTRSLVEDHPLFDGREEEAKEAEPAAATTEEPDWRDQPVSVLALSEPQREALREAEIHNLGELTDFLAEDGFRGLMYGEHGLEYDEAQKVHASMLLWWAETHGGAAVPYTDADDCEYDREATERLIDWIRRERTGDTAPGWFRRSEFSVQLEDGTEIRCVYMPGWSLGSIGSLSLYGPMTGTGFRSDFPREDVADKQTLLDYATTLARTCHAERLKAEARAAKTATRKPRSKSKPSPEPVIETDLEAVLAAESDADADGEDQTEADPLAMPLTNLRLPGPVAGKLIDAGLRTVADLKAPLEKKTGVLARTWGVTAAEVADIRRRFDDLAAVVSLGMGHTLAGEVG